MALNWNVFTVSNFAIYQSESMIRITCLRRSSQKSNLIRSIFNALLRICRYPPNRFQFHQHFMNSFYTQRSQKRKTTLMAWLPFCAFGIFALKSCKQNVGEINTWFQFHQHFTSSFFCAKVFCETFLSLNFGFVIFWQTHICAKAACNMLVILTTGLHIYNLIYNYAVYLWFKLIWQAQNIFLLPPPKIQLLIVTQNNNFASFTSVKSNKHDICFKFQVFCDVSKCKQFQSISFHFLTEEYFTNSA